MDTKVVLLELRKKNGMTQNEMAEKCCVTRQAVSRWENGETLPGIDTLKLISKEFNISLHTILGAENQLICQCCGMPLDEGSLSEEPDGAVNKDYCKWCYTDGKFMYPAIDPLLDFIMQNAPGDAAAIEEQRERWREQLMTLKYWKDKKPVSK